MKVQLVFVSAAAIWSAAALAGKPVVGGLEREPVITPVDACIFGDMTYDLDDAVEAGTLEQLKVKDVVTDLDAMTLATDLTAAEKFMLQSTIQFLDDDRDISFEEALAEFANLPHGYDSGSITFYRTPAGGDLPVNYYALATYYPGGNEYGLFFAISEENFAEGVVDGISIAAVIGDSEFSSCQF